MQQADGTAKSDDGASGPSAVVRADNGQAYVYLYYADRTPILGGDDSVYVARAPLASNGVSGSWQKWTSAGWSAVGDQASASPVVVPAPGDAALQPHVSWNVALQQWLMVFKTGNDFETSTSDDGLRWSQPVSLLAFDPNDSNTGFPTLVSPYTGTQQVTGPTGWLYYSALPQSGTQYIGHRAPFWIGGDE